ncbi:hypothetical protein AB0F93_14075 [Micromonospora tulbaghiae]|uniref:hypothetical protein n=1 Tax=Micromonospora tulbaghiae TaxID=479978 RepID=UPI00331C2454
MERDWLDYTGYVFNATATAAGLFGLFLAIKAYRVGVKAYEVSAESYRVAKDQGRKAFELEILRELRSQLDEVVDSGPWGEHHPALPNTKAGVYSALLALPKEELPLWRMVTKNREPDDELHDIRQDAGVKRYLGSKDEDFEDLQLSICNAMYDEIHEAMRKRIE